MSNVAEGMSATVKTLLFVAVMAVVLGLFFYLSSLDRPPHMPAGITHTLRINTQSKLIGLGPEKVDPRTGRPTNVDESVQYDEKMVENRVNATCTQCHGVPAQDNADHPCQQRTGKCVPEHHPPKLTCIKCHRQKNPGKAPKAGEPVVNMPLFPMPDAEGKAPAENAPGAEAKAPDVEGNEAGKPAQSDGGVAATTPPAEAGAEDNASDAGAAPSAPAVPSEKPSKAAP